MDLIEQINGCGDWSQRLKFIADIGATLRPDPDLMIDDHLISECVSRTWVRIDRSGDYYLFQGYSDSALVRGYLYILFWMIHGKTGPAILSTDIVGEIKKIDLDNIVSPSRSNGMNKIVKYILSRVSLD